MQAKHGIRGAQRPRSEAGIGFSSIYSFLPVFCILLLGVSELGLAEIRFPVRWRQSHRLAPGVRGADRGPGSRAGAGGGEGGGEPWGCII